MEFILLALLTQAISHYGEKALTQVDNKVRNLLIRASDDDTDEKERKKVIAEAGNLLAAWVLKNPGEFETLLDSLVEPADAEVAKDAPTDKLRTYGRILTGTFDIVHALPLPMAALPGWFHSVDCVAFIDARNSELGSWSSDVYTAWPGSGIFERDDPNYWFPDHTGRPRVQVISVADGTMRNEVLERLEEHLEDAYLQENRSMCYARAGEIWRNLAGAADVDPSAVRLVERIYEGKVVLSPPKVGKGDRKSVVAIKGNAGLDMMQAALRSRVRDDATERAAWLR